MVELYYKAKAIAVENERGVFSEEDKGRMVDEIVFNSGNKYSKKYLLKCSDMQIAEIYLTTLHEYVFSVGI